jgi:RNA polymerase sigma-70 factor, ECF subfamily
MPSNDFSKRSGRAHRTAMAILMHRQAAEDVAQEASIIAFRHISSLRTAGSFATWFYRILVREALKQKKALVPSEPLDSDVADQVGPDVTEDLWQALSKLPKAQRTVIALYYFDGFSGAEIAGILGIPKPTVRFRMMYARKRLRRLLSETEPYAARKREEFYAV